jgi:HSP20 family protein
MSLIKKPQGFPFTRNLLSDFFGEDEFFKPEWWNNNWMPAVNISDENGHYTIELAAPGLSKDDLDIKVENGVLTVSSETKSEEEKTEKNYTRREFSYSSFKRSFRLPQNTNEDGICAKYEDGVLYLTVDKKEITAQENSKAIAVE